MNLLLTLIFIVNCLILVFLLLAARAIYRFYLNLSSFLTPGAENQPSPLALISQSLIVNASKVFTSQLKSTFMGIQSGQSRAESAIQSELIQDEANAINPGLGAILASFPALKRKLTKNPALMELALDFLSKKLVHGSGMPGGDGSNDYASRLAKYGG